MKTVLTYGTFDLFHFGHMLLLNRASALGDKLIVGLSTDEFNMLKNKKSVFNFEQRKHMISMLKCVDFVFPEYTWEQKRNDILKHKVDVFVMGDDWAGQFDDLQDVCEVVYLPRTDGISTTMIKNLS